MPLSATASEFKCSLVSERAIAKASADVDKLGIDLPIKGGLAVGPLKPESFRLDEDLTTDDGVERPGTTRGRLVGQRTCPHAAQERGQARFC